MLMQDDLTGYFHDIADDQLYEPDVFAEYPDQFGEYPEAMGEVVYDGLGNPVGTVGMAALLPALAALAPAAGKLFGSLANLIRRRRAARMARAAPPPAPMPMMAPMPTGEEQTAMGDYGEVVYDGLGNPVGTTIGFPFLPAIASALPAVASALPAVAGALPALPAIGRMLPGLFRRRQTAPAPIPPRYMPAGLRMPMPRLMRRPMPMPPGWIRPPIGYRATPRRFYMRCLAWPGPPGLVPAAAGQILPPGAPAPAGSVRRRSHRRRR